MLVNQSLESRFEENRTRLRSVAYRMLGSTSEADDAVQETWIRLDRSDTDRIENLDGWLTTVVSRVSLDMLRSRGSRREDPLALRLPDPIIEAIDETTDPAREAELADSVGLAVLVVLDTLSPAERLAFVLHDMFGVSFDEIAPIVGRNEPTTRQLASRARRRVRGAAADGRPDPVRHREVVEAFLRAARAGDFDALLALLDPDVVLRVDFGATVPSKEVRGAEEVVANARMYETRARSTEMLLVNGLAGLVGTEDGQVVAVQWFTIGDDGAITEIFILADPERLNQP
jgi:RNA polymerase sigma factor (sigma-70 family)